MFLPALTFYGSTTVHFSIFLPPGHNSSIGDSIGVSGDNEPTLAAPLVPRGLLAKSGEWVRMRGGQPETRPHSPAYP